MIMKMHKNKDAVKKHSRSPIIFRKAEIYGAFRITFLINNLFLCCFFNETCKD